VKELASAKRAHEDSGLTEDQIKDLIEEWFGLYNKPDEMFVELTAALSTKNINGYKVRNL